MTDHLFGTLVRTIPWLDYPVLIPVPPLHHDLTIHRLLQSNSSSVANADNELLESVDESTLRSCCKTYSLSSTEMLSRLRIYASERAEADRRRQLGRRGRVESNLEGKARHAIEEGDTFDDDDADDDELQGYFYYAATVLEATRRKEKRRRSSATALMKKSPSSITSPITNPDTILPNSKGERVVTIYDTTEKNDLTSMTMQPSVEDFSLEGASNALRSRQRRPGGDAANDFTMMVLLI